MAKRSELKVELVKAFNDNYIYVLHGYNQDPARKNEAIVIDPGEAQPAVDFLSAQGLIPTHILNTHHHFDHIDGNEILKKKYDCKIVCSEYDTRRVPGYSLSVTEGEVLKIGDLRFEVLTTPGHTMGAVCYYLEAEGVVFTGDTLFAMGCGRLFEGSPEMMWNSLSKIAALPEETRIYCGHEYTEANGEFMAHLDPENVKLQGRLNHVKQQRAQGLPTIPCTLKDELETNEFLRAQSSTEFAELRLKKDNY